MPSRLADATDPKRSVIVAEGMSPDFVLLDDAVSIQVSAKLDRTIQTGDYEIGKDDSIEDDEFVTDVEEWPPGPLGVHVPFTDFPCTSEFGIADMDDDKLQLFHESY